MKDPTLQRDAYNLAIIPGISPYIAIWILAEITNVKQFKNKHNFAAYCGCSPRIVSSAGRTYSACINRHSNKYLRTIFYQATTVLPFFTKKHSVLKVYADRIMERKGRTSSKIALCFVAAKINKTAFALLRDKRPFHPEFVGARLIKSNTGYNSELTVLERELL